MRFNIIFIAVLVSNTAISQIKSGLILSSSDKSPIAYVNLYLKKSSSGTITNEDGNYKLIREIEIDSVVISHIGYKRLALNANDFFKSDYDTIYLDPQIIELENVVIFGGEPIEVIRKAVKNIPKNYPVNKNNISAHFRNIIQENDDYVIFLEGALLIQNQSYLSGKKNLSKVQVLDVRSASNKSKIFTQYKASPENVINASDFFKNKPFLSKDLKHYNFQLVKIVSYENYEVYVIKFEPKSGLKRKYSFAGTVFIETKTLAFIKLGYVITFSDKYSFIKNQGLQNEYNQTFLSDKYEILFKPFDDKWIVSYIKTETKSIVAFLKTKKEIKISLTQELLASRSELNNPKKLNEQKVININEDIYKHSNAFDESLWSEFNQIVPNRKIKALINSDK